MKASELRAKDAAGGAMGRGFRRLFDFLPRRRTAYRRVDHQQMNAVSGS